MYDAVHLYANALAKVLKSGQSARNGTAIVDAIKGSRYLSAMGYMVQIDENGDAGGNYTLLAEDVVSHLNETVYGLVPIGTFSPPAEDSRRGPVSERMGARFDLSSVPFSILHFQFPFPISNPFDSIIYSAIRNSC